MGDHSISILKSLVFFAFFLLPSYLFVPKGWQSWQQWKKTGKVIYLSNTVTAAAATLISYAAAITIIIARILGPI